MAVYGLSRVNAGPQRVLLVKGSMASRKQERSRFTAMDVIHRNALYFRLPINRCLGLCLADARTHCLKIFLTHDSSARCLGPSLPDDLLSRQFRFAPPDLVDADPCRGLAVKSPSRMPLRQAPSGSCSATVAEEGSRASEIQGVFRFQARDNLPSREFGMSLPNR